MRGLSVTILSRNGISHAYGQRVVDELDFIIATLDELLLIVGRGKQELIRDVLLERAVEGCANRIGDTIRNKIPLELQDRYRGRNYWSQWISWRVKLAHQYHQIDVNLLWRDLERDVPDLRQLIADDILAPG
ncbi:MAG: DUF86 domain-containing protein [Gordonia sp. (in: high G+C Gram-positive bacteria)]